jgi:hypothetical protein
MDERSEKPESASKKRKSLPAAVVGQEIPQPPPRKEKITAELSAEAYERLWLHCKKLDMTQSEAIEKLINTYLRRFVISDRGTAEAGDREAAA